MKKDSNELQAIAVTKEDFQVFEKMRLQYAAAINKSTSKKEFFRVVLHQAASNDDLVKNIAINQQ